MLLYLQSEVFLLSFDNAWMVNFSHNVYRPVSMCVPIIQPAILHVRQYLESCPNKSNNNNNNNNNNNKTVVLPRSDVTRVGMLVSAGVMLFKVKFQLYIDIID